jgi:hypothetical protein
VVKASGCKLDRLSNTSSNLVDSKILWKHLLKLLQDYSIVFKYVNETHVMVFYYVVVILSALFVIMNLLMYF